MWAAWHIEALARQKRLPELADLLDGNTEPDDEELEAQLMAWVHSHNAKVNAAKLMGFSED